MGQVINIPESASDYILYGDQRGIVTDYLYNQMQNIPTALTDFGTRIYNNIADTYNYLTNSFVQSNILNAISSNNINIANNYIRETHSYHGMQEANISMQRFIMANPTVRAMYVNDNCAGYPETYTNIFDKDIGKDHYDYRRVTDGMLMSTNEGWMVSYYDEQLEIGDRELEFIDKTKILSTWDAMNWLIDTCKFDFTNPDSESKFNK